MKRMRRSFISVLLVILSGLVCMAQTTPCTLKAEQLPEVRGFKLGMTANEVGRRHPDLPTTEPNPDGYAVREVSDFYVKSYLRPPAGDDLSGVMIAFLDERLVKLRVTYDGLTEWRGVEEFLSAVAGQLKLPAAGNWRAVDPDTRQLFCDGVALQVKLEPKQGRGDLQRPSVTFAMTGIGEVVAERARKRAERQQDRLRSSAAHRPGSHALSIEAKLETAAGGALPVAGAPFYLLDADPVELFEREDVRLARLLSNGEDEDEALVAEFLSSAMAVGEGTARGGSRYLQDAYNNGLAALKPHIVQMVETDGAGRASFNPVAPGSYYLMGGARPPTYAVWKLQINLSSQQTQVRLTNRNTMSRLRTAEDDERREMDRRREAEQKRKVFKP